MVLLTLREMAKGGMNDQLGGGFHRYSVDERWFVPHFEKMLYDQAQLAHFLSGGVPDHAAMRSTPTTARRILDYVLRDMTDPDGGFYSAEDADSVIDPAHPHEKGEGAFYIWTAEEIRGLLARDERRSISASATACATAATSSTIRTASSPARTFCTRRIAERPRVIRQP